MEVYDARGYCMSIGKSERRPDGSVEVFDLGGISIGSVSESKYMQILLRDADVDYANRTIPPAVDLN